MISDSHKNIKKLTLDNHVLIWYSEGTNLSNDQVNIIEQAQEQGNLYISTISIWEVAMLIEKDRIALSISLDEWIEKLTFTLRLNFIDLSIAILTQSCALPKYDYKDPADRLIISSVRSINSHLMTFDQRIIDYADKGYLKVIR